MCGIVGLIDAKQNRSDIEQALGAMCAALEHRGPDDRGIHVIDGGGVGMRRLSIIDLAGGQQPFINESSNLALVFNGEIYNHAALREELTALGHAFSTHSDGEVILHGYEAWGEKVCDRLDGMFAFAIFDTRDRKIFAARDRFGQKPFYYTALGGRGFAFASELKALLTLAAVRPAIHLPAIYHYLTLQYVPDPMTAFDGIRKLPAAHRLRWSPGDSEPRIDRYWRLRYEPKENLGEAEAAEAVKEAADRATRARLMSDVPLGAFLSGGIDSSIIVALMARHASGRVKTFSIGFGEAAFSELPHARRIADRYGAEHHEFEVTPRAAEVLPKIVRAFDEPFADPSAVPVWYLSELTRRHVTVALNGDGGDEIFAGYQRYRLDRWANLYRLIPRIARRPLEACLGALHEPTGVPIERNWRAGLKRLGQVGAADPRASIVRWGSYFSEAMKRRLCTPDFLNEVRGENSELWVAGRFDAADAENYLDRTLAADTETYLPGDLLVKVDRMTMAHSLEGRSPFLDHRLAERVARLPAELKLKGGRLKYILKRAFGDLIPEDLLQRPKQGFGIPVGLWMREGPVADLYRDAAESLGRRGMFRANELERLRAEHRTGRADHGKRLWALLALEHWLQLYID